MPQMELLPKRAASPFLPPFSSIEAMLRPRGRPKKEPREGDENDGYAAKGVAAEKSCVPFSARFPNRFEASCYVAQSLTRYHLLLIGDSQYVSTRVASTLSPFLADTSGLLS